jgi:hypothetical protein
VGGSGGVGRKPAERLSLGEPKIPHFSVSPSSFAGTKLSYAEDLQDSSVGPIRVFRLPGWNLAVNIVSILGGIYGSREREISSNDVKRGDDCLHADFRGLIPRFEFACLGRP